MLQVDLNEKYCQFIGSETIYMHWLPGMWYTEGAKAVADENKCYWFLDIIASHQLSQQVVSNYFQVWRLIREKGTRFEARCEDGDGKTLLVQMRQTAAVTARLANEVRQLTHHIDDIVVDNRQEVRQLLVNLSNTSQELRELSESLRNDPSAIVWGTTVSAKEIPDP